MQCVSQQQSVALNVYICLNVHCAELICLPLHVLASLEFCKIIKWVDGNKATIYLDYVVKKLFTHHGKASINGDKFVKPLIRALSRLTKLPFSMRWYVCVWLCANVYVSVFHLQFLDTTELPKSDTFIIAKFFNHRNE